jgi:toxin ParE1/3/4
VTRVWFLPAALEDVGAAVRWYEAEQRGLGDAFASAVERAVDHVLSFPEACPVVHRDARRYLIERFPYCLYFRVEGDGVIVVALLHASRDPETHRGRLHE